MVFVGNHVVPALTIGPIASAGQFASAGEFASAANLRQQRRRRNPPFPGADSADATDAESPRSSCWRRQHNNLPALSPLASELDADAYCRRFGASRLPAPETERALLGQPSRRLVLSSTRASVTEYSVDVPFHSPMAVTKSITALPTGDDSKPTSLPALRLAMAARNSPGRKIQTRLGGGGPQCKVGHAW